MLVHRLRRWPNITPTLVEFFVYTGEDLSSAVENMTANVGVMLVHRLRRWPNITPTLGDCLVYTGEDLSCAVENMTPNVGVMLFHRLRRWPIITPTLGDCLVYTGEDLSCAVDTDSHLIWLGRSQRPRSSDPVCTYSQPAQMRESNKNYTAVNSKKYTALVWQSQWIHNLDFITPTCKVRDGRFVLRLFRF